MPRAYTKSGSVEKYEPSLFSTGTYAFATVSARDDNGNYSITAASGYKKDSNGSYLLATYYGGVPYYAKFSPIIITFSLYVQTFWGYLYNPLVVGLNMGIIYGGYELGEMLNEILSNIQITVYFDVVYNTSKTKSWSGVITASDTNGITEIFDDITAQDSSIPPRITNCRAVPSSGTYNGIKWLVKEIKDISTNS